MMLWCVLLTAWGLASTVAAINRPVYKVILTQKGFTQFVQYDVETPPIREFTFCTWIKVYGYQNEQSIFTYIVNGNKRVVRLWLDSGGRHLKVLFKERELASVVVDLGLETWRHVCLSYQSDFGAWALYLDSRLVSCEASQGLQFFVIPGGGSVILGYGTTEQGSPTGLEGEIFGANMILTSTIGRNHSIQNNPQYLQKTFSRNKIRTTNNIDYVVLKDLDTDESPNNAKETKLPARHNKSTSFIKVQTPYSYIHHAIGIEPTTTHPLQVFHSSASHETEIIDLVMNPKPRTVHHTSNIWNSVNRDSSTEKFKVQVKPGNELSSSDTHNFLSVSEYETPPPLQSMQSNYLAKTFEPENFPAPNSMFKLHHASTTQPFNNKNIYQDDIPDVEVPPPPEKNTKVYGQWTSSKYAGSVLNYLKSINYYKKEKKVPPTIPLTKVSNNFPYPSNFNSRVIRPPTNLQKKNMLAEKRLQDQYQPSSLRGIHKEKRELRKPQINIKIVKDNIRTEILNSHARAHPKHVEITNRGESDKIMFKPNFEDDGPRFKDSHRVVRNNDNEIHQSKGGSSMFNVLPFLKSFEYFTGDTDVRLAKASDDMYIKSFSTANKWHNIKTYNNDYTPRHVPGLDIKDNHNDNRHPAIRLKYKPENHKVIHLNNDEPMIKGRQLAKDVSHQSENNNGKVSILKYNHGFLPGHSEEPKHSKSQQRDAELRSKNEFHKHVKIGNALNERNVIGQNYEEKKHSFLGGDEKIPDINRYRSDIDNENQSHVPPSLRPKVCKNVELLDHLLYVHPDGSIKMSQIVSPIQTKNIALEFVIQNYKKCSLDGSQLENNSLLLINWNKTPVRLFGGAVAKKTKDLCGFF